MTLRGTTQIARSKLAEDVLALLTLAPNLTWDDVLERVPASKSTIQRAFRARGTTFDAVRRGALLDRAALVLIEQYARGETIALLNAGRAAGYRPRHLCAPFSERFGMTPGKVWAVGAAIRGLRTVAETPSPHSRRESAAYARRRRRINRLRGRLEDAREELVAGTVVAERVEAALRLNFRPPHARTRPRRRARPRRGSRGLR